MRFRQLLLVYFAAFVVVLFAPTDADTNTTTTLTAPAADGGTTPAPTPAPFCIDCGFNFGHVITGLDDKTAGMLLVAIIVTLLVAIACCVACCAHNSCCGPPTDYQRVASKAAGDV